MNDKKQQVMNDKRQQAAEQLIELGHYLLDHQLAWGNSGNMSLRLDESTMMITATGTYMGNLQEDDFAIVNISTGQWLGERKPSKEIPMHAAIYKRRADANVVIHSSPFWSTLLATSNMKLQSELFVESMYYTENAATVEYCHPGSSELGQAVYEACESSEIIFLKNHGVMVYDDNVKEARMRLETLEMTSRMLVTASSAGILLTKLDALVVQDFLENSGYKPRKKR